MDEVAQLAAVGILLAITPEQAHGLAAANDGEVPRNHAHHAALVILVRAVDVEEFQADALRRKQRTPLSKKRNPPVDQMLAPAVGVQRLQVGKGCATRLIVKTRGSISIGR